MRAPCLAPIRRDGQPGGSIRRPPHPRLLSIAPCRPCGACARSPRRRPPGSAQQETLTFWTARGLLRLACRVEAVKVHRRRRCRQGAGARGGPADRREGARGEARPPRPGPRRGARCLARPRAAHAAERRHRLCRDPEERALRPARQPPLSRLRARYLRQRAACARRRRQHAAGRSHALGAAVAGLRRRRPRRRGRELPDGGASAGRAGRPRARRRAQPPPAAHRRRRARRSGRCCSTCWPTPSSSRGRETG